jgi:hypothetical protein
MQLLRYVSRPQMGVTEQHAWIAVATDEAYLWNGQTLLEEPADGLVSEVVESQVFDLGPASDTLPS